MDNGTATDSDSGSPHVDPIKIRGNTNEQKQKKENTGPRRTRRVPSVCFSRMHRGETFFFSRCLLNDACRKKGDRTRALSTRKKTMVRLTGSSSTAGASSLGYFGVGGPRLDGTMVDMVRESREVRTGRW